MTQTERLAMIDICEMPRNEFLKANAELAQSTSPTQTSHVEVVNDHLFLVITRPQ